MDLRILKHFRKKIGKTLNLSMLRRFFEDERTPKGEKIDNRHLFEGLAVMDAGEKYIAHMGAVSGHFLVAESGKQREYRLAYGELKKRIKEEFKRHQYVLTENVLAGEECEEALAQIDAQIDAQDYAAPLTADGYRPILKYGIALYKKGCVVKIKE